MKNTNKIIESKIEIDDFLSKMIYSIQTGNAAINMIDNTENRDPLFTNVYTIGELFPAEDVSVLLSREICKLTSKDYIETILETFGTRSRQKRVFCKIFDSRDVYIKISFSMLGRNSAKDIILVLSFHFAERSVSMTDYPYRD